MTTLAVTAQPRSFTPPGDRTARLAHLDPRPLYRERLAAPSPWSSPTFWLAGAIVLPMAGLVRLARALG